MSDPEILTATLATREPMHPATPPTPMVLLQMAIDQNADLDRLERLMALQDRWEASEARKAYTAAMAAFKADPPEIHKNKTVNFTTAKGTTNYKHATLDEVAGQIGAAMAPHGLSFRWNVEQNGGRIKVTCILTHKAGHSEQVQMEGNADDSGNKNSIQQTGSTVTYLERYTLLALSGMAVVDQDNDGRQTADKAFGMSEGTFQGHLKAIREAECLVGLQAAFTTAWNASKADKPTQKAILEAKDKRKSELAGGAK